MEDNILQSSEDKDDVQLNDSEIAKSTLSESEVQKDEFHQGEFYKDESHQGDIQQDGLQQNIEQSVSTLPVQENVDFAAAQIQTVPKVSFIKRYKGLSSLTGGLAYSLVVLLYLGLSLLTLLIQRLAHIDSDNEVFTYLSMLVAPLAITVSIIVIMATRKVKFKQICPVKTHPKYYLIAVLLTVGLIFIGSIASGIFLLILQLLGYTPSNSGFMPDMSGAKIIPVIICVAVVPAFFEELFFRGLLLHSTEQSMGSVRAILVTGFSFALMHGSPLQTVHQFLLGCAVAFLTIRSGSVLPGMLAHFLNNLIAVLVTLASDFLGADMTPNIAEGVSLIMSGVMLLTITGAVCAFLWLIYDKRKKPHVKCSSGGVRTYFIGASVGIGIMSVMWLLDLFIGFIS